MSESRRRRAAPTRGPLTGRVAIVAFALAVPVVTMALPVRAWFAQQTQVSELEQQVAASQERVDELSTLNERWDDPAYVEAQARERLHVVRPGEIGFTVIRPEPSTAPVAANSAAGEESPWFSRLWESVQSADDGS